MACGVLEELGREGILWRLVAWLAGGGVGGTGSPSFFNSSLAHATDGGSGARSGLSSTESREDGLSGAFMNGDGELGGPAKLNVELGWGACGFGRSVEGAEVESPLNLDLKKSALTLSSSTVSPPWTVWFIISFLLDGVSNALAYTS